jgi:hypothetical protein
MKIDRALTMEECLDKWCVVPMRVDPLACDARHIPIAEEKGVYSETNARSCNCDRWGHPCPSCSERRTQPRLALTMSLPGKQLT